MSEAEIQYLVPISHRPHGDSEKILNAMGDYQIEQPFQSVPEAYVVEVEDESVMIRLVKDTRSAKPEYELREESERMRRGVEGHFSEEDRARLSRLFVGIAFAGATETE